MSEPVTLHGYYRSSASFRVRIALNLKGIAYEDAFHHLRRGEQRAPDYLNHCYPLIRPRACVRALAQVVACDIHPIDNLRVLNNLRKTLHQPKDAIKNWYNRWIADGFGAIEAMLAASPATG